MSARGRRAVVLLGAVALASACRFEKRPDLAAEIPSDTSAVLTEDAARAILTAVTDALAAGDAARVAQLTAPDAVLLDQDEEVRWTPADPGGRLPAPLLVSSGGLSWQPVASTFIRIAPDAALFSLRYQRFLSRDPVTRTAVESWVLVRTVAGWKVQYLHRSRGLAASEARP